MDNRDRNPDLDRDENDLENPLGISGTPVTPDAPEHLRASNDPEEAQRRRKRGLSADNDEDRSSGMDDVNLNHKGATAIDIGADRGTK